LVSYYHYHDVQDATAAYLCWLTLIFSGVLTIVADFMGAIGSGTGLLLAVTTIYECVPQRCHLRRFLIVAQVL
jgi:preprotein translocase subunit SecY